MIRWDRLGVRDSALVVDREHALDLNFPPRVSCDEKSCELNAVPTTLFWLSARTHPTGDVTSALSAVSIS